MDLPLKKIKNTNNNLFAHRLFISAVALSLVSTSALADGLSDLKSALAKLKGSTPVAAEITNRFEQSRGSDDDVVVKNGFVKLRASDSPNGLAVFYDAETLALMDLEAKARVEDEDVNTPTLMGLNNNLGTMDMRIKFSSAAHLEKRLMQATFVSEEEYDIDGTAHRKLRFDLPVDAIISDKTTRKYVDRFDAFYNIIIDSEGNPVESELSFKGRGRAYLVLSVKAEVSSKSRYQVHGERLLQITHEYQGKFESSLWPDSQYFGGHELALIDEQDMLAQQN
jgi:hypothetical protein